MSKHLVVLEEWKLPNNSNAQRLVYDAEQDRIFHEFGCGNLGWMEDYTTRDGSNVYLINFNSGNP